MGRVPEPLSALAPSVRGAGSRNAGPGTSATSFAPLSPPAPRSLNYRAPNFFPRSAQTNPGMRGAEERGGVVPSRDELRRGGQSAKTAQEPRPSVPCGFVKAGPAEDTDSVEASWEVCRSRDEPYGGRPAAAKRLRRRSGALRGGV
eukprot:29717-Chlamydomonas_euryale.AAC.4